MRKLGAPAARGEREMLARAIPMSLLVVRARLLSRCSAHVKHRRLYARFRPTCPPGHFVRLASGARRQQIGEGRGFGSLTVVEDRDES